jgi:PEP-CTERM motif
MRTKFLVTALVASLALAAPASATVVFTDNFDTEDDGPATGGSSINYTGFANWSVEGKVDVVQSGDFGITCPGKCVDLDGSPGPGGIQSLPSFSFNAGDIITFSLDLSGNQRGGGSDPFQAGWRSQGGAIAYNNVQLLSAAFGNSSFGSFLQNDLVGSGGLAPGVPFGNFTLQFTAGNSGSFKLFLGTASADNVGPLVDNVSLDIAAVPEPASWALMIAGFGLVGGALRSRKPLTKHSIA